MPPKEQGKYQPRSETISELCAKKGHLMYMCPERATMCKDIASYGSLIKGVACFNCFGPHGVKNCPHDRYKTTKTTKTTCSHALALDPAPSPRPPTKAP